MHISHNKPYCIVNKNLNCTGVQEQGELHGLSKSLDFFRPQFCTADVLEGVRGIIPAEHLTECLAQSKSSASAEQFLLMIDLRDALHPSMLWLCIGE